MRSSPLHVNHGLQPQADDWVEHCAHQARQLGVAFQALKAQSAAAPGDSIEAWARDERYRLLLDATRTCGAAALLTAHHADDQVETFLMALARGSGLDGLSGIAASDLRQGVRLLRPLLSFDRSHLLRRAQSQGWHWIEDPSNANESFLRNAVRAQVMPVLRKCSQACQHTRTSSWARSATGASRHMRTHARIWMQRAANRGAGRHWIAGCWQACRRWQSLALRLWLREAGCRMPSRDRLEQMRRQLLLGQGAHAQIEHDGLQLMRHRHVLLACPQSSQALAAVQPTLLRWNGQSSLELACGGRMVFEPAVSGVSRSWLAQQSLLLAPAQAGARLRMRVGGRSRSVKNLWQEAAIPVFLRDALPAVWVESRLLMAAPFGMDRSPDWPSEPDGIAMRWVPSDEDPRQAFNNLVK